MSYLYTDIIDINYLTVYWPSQIYYGLDYMWVFAVMAYCQVPVVKSVHNIPTLQKARPYAFPEVQMLVPRAKLKNWFDMSPNIAA